MSLEVKGGVEVRDDVARMADLLRGRQRHARLQLHFADRRPARAYADAPQHLPSAAADAYRSQAPQGASQYLVCRLQPHRRAW